MAAEPRRAVGGRCCGFRAPHPGGPASTNREKDRRGCAGSRPDLHRPVQPAGGTLLIYGYACGFRLLVSLTPDWFVQIVKILTLYTPHSDLDERVTVNFIRTIQVRPRGSRSHPRSASRASPHLPPPAGSSQRTLRWPAPAAPDGRQTSVPRHISLLASPCPPRRAVSHSRLPQDLLSTQSLKHPPQHTANIGSFKSQTIQPSHFKGKEEVNFSRSFYWKQKDSDTGGPVTFKPQ